ncbi:DAO domain-containing protein [Mycena sanguinolenta]|uniref:DAO domain-containing protein n=1 Tax=Mycena sanguinolenta TaxID=230812 RepID=A0A8H6Z0W2_9AGAR|nr:DAO domain-containing protein [Mycena sanguinolenta]
MLRFCILFILLGLAQALSASSYYSPQTPFKTSHKPADLPQLNPTHSFWIDSLGANPLADEGSTGTLTDAADVCIIGSGITGVSAAYHLANTVKSERFPVPHQGTKVRAVILEAREFCSGATGRNGGNLTPYEFFSFNKIQSLFGHEAALRFYAVEDYSVAEMVRIAKESGWADEVDLVEGGHLNVMLTESDLSELQEDFASAIAAGRNVNASWLSREEMNATFGTYNWGVRTPGYNLWPLKFVTQLFKQSLKITPQLDLRLHTHTPVTSISPANSASPSVHRWTLTTPRGSVYCSSVLHATNGYASHLLPHMAGPSGIVPVREQVVAIRAAAPPEVLSTTSWLGNEGYWFPRPLEPSKSTPLVILGGARSAAGPPFEVDTTDDSVINGNVGIVLRNFLPEMFPGLYAPGQEPEAEWTGIMGFTSLDIPFVGPVLSSHSSTPPNLNIATLYKGQFISAGYAGHGMPRAFACAEVVVQMILDEFTGTEWISPAWFPKPFLTWVRDDEN